jgi:mono/diheme cytochrome c family protein
MQPGFVVRDREMVPMSATTFRWCAALGVAALAAILPAPSRAGGPTLTVTAAGVTHRFDRDALLARADVAEITTSRDVAYGVQRRYRAVPLANLMAPFAIPADAVVEVVAQDGFVAQLPSDLIGGRDGEAVPYLAIETEDEPWPQIPGKDKSAGPFYIIWLGAHATSVPAADWPYQVVSLAVQEAPTTRWPALAVDPRLPPLDPARAGQILFINKCFTCHTLNHAGTASAGPDLNLPMNPTEYLSEPGLRALIRDPRSVRVWPEQRMPGFAQADLSDEELGMVVAYLRHMAGRKSP